MRGHNQKKDTHTLDFDVTLLLFRAYLSQRTIIIKASNTMFLRPENCCIPFLAAATPK
jgi:hypothetical protein